MAACDCDIVPRTSNLHQPFLTPTTTDTSLAECGDPWGCMTISSANARERFPELKVSPAPEPNREDKERWEKWYRGYKQWGKVKCHCGNGYFCKEHGEWNPGSAVVQGSVPPRSRQGEGYCVSSHYSQDGYAEEEEEKEEEEEEVKPGKVSSSRREHASYKPETKSKGKSRDESKHKKSSKDSKSEKSRTDKSRQHRSSKSDKDSSRGDKRSSKSRDHNQAPYPPSDSRFSEYSEDPYNKDPYNTQRQSYNTRDQDDQASTSTYDLDPSTADSSVYEHEYDTDVDRVMQGVHGMNMGHGASYADDEDDAHGYDGYDTGHYSQIPRQYTTSYTTQTASAYYQYPQQYSTKAPEEDPQYGGHYGGQYGGQYGVQYSTTQYTYQEGSNFDPEQHQAYAEDDEAADPAARGDGSKKSKSRSSKKDGKRRSD